MGNPNPPHIALLPSPGMGQLTPFLHLASALSSTNCLLTLFTPETTLSSAESNRISSFLTTHPQIKHLTLDTISPDPSSRSGADPFFAEYEAFGHSVHLALPQLLSASPPVSAVFCDLLAARSVAAICKELSVPFYTLFSVSAMFLSFVLHLPVFASRSDMKIRTSSDLVDIPGLPPLPMSTINHPFMNPDHILGAVLVANVPFLTEAKRLLVNTFEWFERETLNALNSGKVSSNLPPVFAIGPLKTYELEKDQSQSLQWLDQQPMNSVVYVSFGSRTPISNDQIKELRNGLEKSGCRFLWVLKTSIVDKEDKDDLRDLLGYSFLERTKGIGLVVKAWVNQQEILAHKAIGGFVSHCGWNSVMEAAENGVPVLAWPQHGDQRMNAEIVIKTRLGIWERNWGLKSEELVKEDEIAEKILQLMDGKTVRERATIVGEEARNASKTGGSSEEAILSLLSELGC